MVAYKPLLDGAIELASHNPNSRVILQREQHPCDLGAATWTGILSKRTSPCAMRPVEGNHPAYILYTSGTTGAPKGRRAPHRGHLVALNWTMKNIYDVDPGDVFWAASDVGWVVGHSYICYAPLIHGNTTVVFEGKPVGTPDAGTFWRVISEHNVRSFFHRTHRIPRGQTRRPQGQAGGRLRPVRPARAVPRRRTRRSRHDRMGAATFGQTCV